MTERNPEPPPSPEPTLRAESIVPVSHATESGFATVGDDRDARRDGPLPQVGGYKLLGVLGRGGMGVVYRAEDTHLKREVALKLMLPEAAADARAKARFLREARAQAKVEHEHVAVIHNVGEEGGVPYLVMPLLKGMTLHAALKANPRPPLTEVVRIGREIAEGLAAAHEQGLVHRDIKPANVWLEGKRLRVKVLDFGLARAVSEQAAEGADGPLTREGVVVGTPQYMSPEQARGKRLDERTDLFSLGVVLYQMTTGELPFGGGSPLAVLASVAGDAPPVPAEKNPAVPLSLSNLVMRLMAKEPAARPASAEAVAGEMRAIEAELAGAVRVIALGSAPPPVVVSLTGPDPFADLDATEAPTAAVTERDSAAPPRPRRSAGVGSALPVWAVAAGVVVAVGGLIWFVGQKLGTRPAPAVVQKPDDGPGTKDNGDGGRPVKPKDDKQPVVPKGKDARLAAMEELVARGARITDGTRALTAAELSPFVVPYGIQITSGRYRLAFPIQPDRDEWATGEVARPLADADLDLLADLPLGAFFTLVGQNVTDRGVEKLVGFPGVQGITRLYLMHCPLGDDTVRHAARLPKLELLVLDGTNVTDAGLKHLAGRPIARLTLRDTLVTDAALPQLAKFAALTHLDLRGTRVTEAGYKKLRGELPRCKIAWEEPNRAAAAWLLTRDGVQVALELANGETLIATKPEELPKEAFTVVGVTCGVVKFGDADIKRLEPLTGLTSFHIWNREPGLTDDGLRSFPKWKSTLTELRLSDQPFTSEGMKSIGELVELKTLHLNANDGTTGDGLAHLARLPKLDYLVLGYSRVGDRELKHLVGLKLRVLELAGTAVTDEGLETLARMKTLRELDLRKTAVTEAGCQKLRDALPECKIKCEELKK